MAMPRNLRLSLPSPDATSDLAGAIAPLLRPGDVILLTGPIGAGKTHFARSVIQARLAAAGRLEDVPSPTFTLVQTYDDGIAEIWHADLYRLSSPDDIAELGLEDAFMNAIVLVEWPDRAPDMMPSNALGLTLAAGEDPDAREATIKTSDPRWESVLNLVIERMQGSVVG